MYKRLNESGVKINPHHIFHDCMGDSEQFDFLVAEVSNLTTADKVKLMFEAFGEDIFKYVDAKRMSIEVLGDDDD